MSDWMIFAERLSEQMKKQNLSIRQLAERMDMTPTTIFRYAKGRRVPRVSEILKASEVLGVTCDYLVGLSDDPKKTANEQCIGEKKSWIPPKTDKAAKRLNDLIFDINPAEICSQIESDNLKNWCNIIQTEMKMAMVQLPCWTERREDE